MKSIEVVMQDSVTRSWKCVETGWVALHRTSHELAEMLRPFEIPNSP